MSLSLGKTKSIYISCYDFASCPVNVVRFFAAGKEGLHFPVTCPMLRQTPLFLLFLCSLILSTGGCGTTDPVAPSPTTSPHPVEVKSTETAPSQSVNNNALLPSLEMVKETPRELQDGDLFENVAEQVGVDFVYQNGLEAAHYQLIETLGGGAALFDFDQDGDLDIFVSGGGGFSDPPLVTLGKPGVFYRNDLDADGGAMHFVDVTSEVGLAAAPFYSHGCAVGDYDADGFPDLLVAGHGGCQLFRNEAGKCFTDRTAAAGLIMPSWCVAGAFADIDRDGDLDLYVATYATWQPDATRQCISDRGKRDVCAPAQFAGARDYLWENCGDGTFQDITDGAGITLDGNRGLGVVAVDFDSNGWVDFFVANDVQPNALYSNHGDGRFESTGLVAGVAFSATGKMEGSMGVDVGDFNGDGAPDIHYTNYTLQDNSLAQNDGRGGFTQANSVTNLFHKSTPWVGWGTAFLDLDGDGWEDLIAINGHAGYEYQDGPYFQPSQIFRNQQGKQFKEITARAGPYFSVPHAGRGLAIGDLDNDGGVDLVVVNQNEPVAVLRNRQPYEHWVRLRLRGTQSNRDAVGAKITLVNEKQTLTRWIRGGGGYASHFDFRVLLPWNDSRESEIEVHWPSGGIEWFGNLAPKVTHELVEGQGKEKESAVGAPGE